MNRKIFFEVVRHDPLNGSLSQNQVEGMNAILDGWDKRCLTDLRWLAYMLATAFHETAQSMQPIKEFGGRDYFMRMYDKTGSRPMIASALGNTEAGDGARFCGRGYVQLTGRANYTKASKKLGVDFVHQPTLVMMPDHAANIMFFGMIEGWFTGKKLSDYFGDEKSDWKNARRIINRLDKASTIADYAKAFHTALRAAYAATPVGNSVKPATQSGAAGASIESKKPPDSGRQADRPNKPPQGGIFYALITFVSVLFGRK